MDIQEIKQKIESWEDILLVNQKHYIHYQSMRNFISHFNRLPTKIIQDKVILILTEYVEEVEANNFEYDLNNGYDLADNYLRKISNYYYDFLGFKPVLKLKFVLFYGIIADSILYLIGFLTKIYYIPLVTSILFLYFLFLLFFKRNKKLVYGLYY